jgi:hypothetical protein
MEGMSMGMGLGRRCEEDLEVDGNESRIRCYEFEIPGRWNIGSIEITMTPIGVYIL